MAYFQNFPLVNYLYGGETSPSLAQNLTVAVSLIDELKGNTTFYNSFEIKDNERPDTLSYLLYGTTDYYWTFYFLNQDLRESGWPLTEKEILPLAKTSYPNFVFTTGLVLAIIAVANNAAFIAPSSPIAKAPTGIPFGI